jgi:hypothetical protein
MGGELGWIGGLVLIGFLSNVDSMIPTSTVPSRVQRSSNLLTLRA